MTENHTKDSLVSRMKNIDHRRKSIFEFCIVVLIFIVLSCILTNGVIFNINTQLFTAGIGDATSGFLWLLYADNTTSYLHAHTNLVNFPYGENLWSPLYTTWLLVLGPLWIVSRFLSPI